MTKLNKFSSLGDYFIKISQQLVVADFLQQGDLASFLVVPQGVAFQEVVAFPQVVASLQEVACEKVKPQGVVELLEVVASFQGVGVVTFQGVVCGEQLLVWSRLDMQQL